MMLVVHHPLCPTVSTLPLRHSFHPFDPPVGDAHHELTVYENPENISFTFFQQSTIIHTQKQNCDDAKENMKNSDNDTYMVQHCAEDLVRRGLGTARLIATVV
jgi:hypothetical protein